MINGRPDLPSTFQPANISEIAVGLPIIFNTLAVRRTIIPAANGHCSARALAWYYAALAAGGIVPEPHSSQPPLGSHLHIPKFPPLKPHKKRRRSKQAKTQSADKVSSNKNTNDKNTKVGSRSSKTDGAIENGQHGTTGVGSNSCNVKDGSDNVGKIFKNPRIHDAFLGVGDYGNLALPNGKFGLGFSRFSSGDHSLTAFGHSGIGGSMGFCDIRHDFAIAVTVNKMSLGGVTRSIIRLVCSELNVPLPDEFSRFGERGPDMQMNFGNQIIN